MTPVVPGLFDGLIEYAKEIALAKVKPGKPLPSTSPALTFCENFYAQWFQNVLKKEIKRFSPNEKERAVRLRLELKEAGGASVIIHLITWYEKLCDIYPDVLALGYTGGSKATLFEFHNNYLLTLLERAEAWARADGQTDIAEKAKSTSTELKTALESIAK